MKSYKWGASVYNASLNMCKILKIFHPEKKMKKFHGKFVWKTFKFTIALFCGGFFVYFSLDVWDKFSHKFTATGVRFVDQELPTKQLPCITVCPWEAFRKKGFHYNMDEFMLYTFDEYDLFLNKSIGGSDFHQMETLNSIFYGRCFMTCSTNEMKTNKYLNFAFKRLTDLTGMTKIHTKYKFWKY